MNEHLRNVRFFSIVMVTSCATGGLMYSVSVFNNAAPVVLNFTRNSWLAQTGQCSVRTSQVLYNVISAIPLVGAIFGSASGDILAEKWGRNWGLIMTSCINIMGTVIASLATPFNLFELMLVGRLVQGVAMGLGLCIGPIFIAEISPTKRRSFSAPLIEIAVTSSQCLAAMLGSSSILGTIDRIWLLQSLLVIPSVFLILTMFLCPESPHYLYLSKGDRMKTIDSIVFYQSSDQVESSIAELEMEAEYTDEVAGFRWADLWSVRYRKAFLIALVVGIGFNSSGITVIAVYSTSVLLDSGLSRSAAQKTTNATLLVGIGAAVVWIIVVDKVGRKRVFMIAMYGVSLLFFLLAAFNLVSQTESWAPVACAVVLMLNVVPNYGADTIHWFIVTEMFDKKARSKAVAAASVLNWTANSLATVMVYEVMVEIGAGYALIPIAILALATAIFATIFLPETKHRTFLEVLMEIQGNTETETVPLLGK